MAISIQWLLSQKQQRQSLLLAHYIYILIQTRKITTVDKDSLVNQQYNHGYWFIRSKKVVYGELYVI
ncbi:hypothetical protein C476_16575 [Natrinema limicola JCM 13563]|uniref:Uncharacterized protein n=1 Tax=Natrinema limicola JCM 13563 TaxID=1230457 RepID=M0C177_9EURY|nr:hypothetical protein C476_16575 [Natrinema limicola JCM 13563]